MGLMLPKDFYKNVEIPGYINQYIKYSDTDSIFIVVPHKNVDDMSIEEKWNLADDVANKINDIIIKYNKEYLLPTFNINPDQNRTFFKTELIMESVLFLDVKKNYAFKLIIKDGKALDVPQIIYKNIAKKSDVSLITKLMSKSLIERVALNKDMPINTKFSEAKKIIDEYVQQFNEDIKTYKFNKIGIPGKWIKKPQMINGMKLYNFINNSNTFTFGSFGMFIYCNFINPLILKDQIDIKNTTGICVPYNYSTEELISNMNKYAILPDKNTQWDTVYTKTCERIINLIKKISKN